MGRVARHRLRPCAAHAGVVTTAGERLPDRLDDFFQRQIRRLHSRLGHQVRAMNQRIASRAESQTVWALESRGARQGSGAGSFGRHRGDMED